MTTLAEKKCEPCQGGVEPLKGAALREHVEQLNSGWEAAEEHHLQKEFTFDDFRSALEFVVKVGKLADKEDHHPDIFLTYGKVKIMLWTHKIDGLHENDFILAAKIEQL